MARVALVTGTSAGIGEAVAQRLLDRDWKVIGIARRPPTISHTAYRHVSYDLAQVTGNPSVLETEIQGFLGEGLPTRAGLVNNAAVPEGLMPLDRLQVKDLARIYAVNVIAPIWLMGLFTRLVPRDSALRIVNVSSGAATMGFPGLAAYGSSKAALRLAGMSLASEWKSDSPAHVRPDAAILSYEPGVVETDMQRYARARPHDEFPWVGMFLEFEARRVLVPPERPAADIVSFLESDHQPPFAERRLRP